MHWELTDIANEMAIYVFQLTFFMHCLPAFSHHLNSILVAKAVPLSNCRSLTGCCRHFFGAWIKIQPSAECTAEGEKKKQLRACVINSMD